jgi:hypothetical protein
MLLMPDNENKQKQWYAGALCKQAGVWADDRADLQWVSSLKRDVGRPEQASD